MQVYTFVGLVEGADRDQRLKNKPFIDTKLLLYALLPVVARLVIRGVGSECGFGQFTWHLRMGQVYILC